MVKLKDKWVISQLLPKATNRGDGELIWSTNNPFPTRTHVLGVREGKEREKEEKREKKERESEVARKFLQSLVSAFSQSYFELLYSRYHA